LALESELVLVLAPLDLVASADCAQAQELMEVAPSSLDSVPAC
jgi:hypothetical protein